MEQKRFNFLEFLTVVVRWRRLILVNVVVVGVLSAMVSLLMPKWYKGKAIVLPPERQGVTLGMGAIGELAGTLMGPSGFELPIMATKSDVYETILGSRRVATSVLEENDLYTLYKTKNIDEAIRSLHSHTKVEVGRDGSIHIAFEAKEDPELAAQVANSFVRQLNEVNVTTSRSKAKSSREFIEKRLAETKIDLADAEEALREFQEEYNTISIEDQTKATIDGAAQLIVQLMSMRIELSYLRESMSPSHAKVAELNRKIAEIDKILKEIQQGSDKELVGTSNTRIDSDVYIPLKRVPEVGLRLARLTREVKIQELLFELLTQQHEQAKIREAEDTPTIQVLEYAQPPTLKSRPKRAVIVLVSTGFAFFASIFLAFLLDCFERSRKEGHDEWAKIASIVRDLKQDIAFLKRRRDR